jgi:ubiquinone biosynthesis protein
MGIPVRRYEQISSVLIKYGFEAAIKDLLPKKLLRNTQQRTSQCNADLYRRMKLAVQELGPTFVKFAQIMSTRRELLPPELINEFKELTDGVKPVSFDRIKPTIEEQCGPIEETFSYIEEQPFAAASLSQAHLAKLKDGTVLVLKIQRPGIQEVIETDLEILQNVATHLDKSKPELKVYNLPVMVHEFSHQILSELDFVRDGKNAELAAANIADIKGVRVPKIYWAYTGPKMLAMEYVKGVRLDKVEAIKAMDLDPKEIALKGFMVFMKEIFVDGFFHGDPHPGNILVTPEGELVILDFGLVGILRPEKRDQFLRLLLNIVDRDVNGLVESLRGLGVKIDAGQEQLKDELYLAMMRSSNSGKNSTVGSFEEVISILRKYHIKVPGDAMLMIKVVMMLDGEVRMLYPDFDFVRESQSIVTQMATDSIMDGANIRRTAFALVNTLQNTSELPGSINDAFKTVSRGNFNLNIANDDIDRLGKSIDHAAYKGLLGMILASIVVGMSLVVVAMREVLNPSSFGLAVAAYLIAIAAGVYSVYHLIRNK